MENALLFLRPNSHGIITLRETVEMQGETFVYLRNNRNKNGMSPDPGQRRPSKGRLFCGQRVLVEKGEVLLNVTIP